MSEAGTPAEAQVEARPEETQQSGVQGRLHGWRSLRVPVLMPTASA